jgi:hypothetical protein
MRIRGAMMRGVHDLGRGAMPIILPSPTAAKVMRAHTPWRFLLAVVIRGQHLARRGWAAVAAIYGLVQALVAGIDSEAGADMLSAAWSWVLIALGVVLLVGIGRAVWQAFWQARYDAFDAFKSADRGASAATDTLTELRVIEGQVRGARRSSCYPDTFDLPTSKWEAHGAALPPMSVEEWQPIVAAYALATRLNERVRERTDRKVEPRDDLDGLVAMLEKACKTLESLANSA